MTGFRAEGVSLRLLNKNNVLIKWLVSEQKEYLFGRQAEWSSHLNDEIRQIDLFSTSTCSIKNLPEERVTQELFTETGL